MFDPTVFDNLKVVLEGAVYDMDSEGQLQVIGRTDRIELSAMSRFYAIKFTLPEQKDTWAELRLWADTEDLAGEIMELGSVTLGCHMQPVFFKYVRDPATDCPRIEQLVTEIWGRHVGQTQRISTIYGQSDALPLNEISVHFMRRFGEEVIQDLPQMLEHMLIMLEQL
ncbi:hypothetical protein [Paenibacillus brevis]|uniref:Uncharacterized protein n=1 Tax=Paenibacillus brevis TaxID=2841508 RepID=A0ABS6FQQ5_9BACL|nr:hypothetical protein [Paenibacillus brevis]MBU5672560.1 hypothetical protein [Paenibacillus brevis]